MFISVTLYKKCHELHRNARKKDILKAYRKLAVKWHPDKHEEGPEKEKAQKMFIDLAAAKEVLTDPGINIYVQFS